MFSMDGAPSLAKEANRKTSLWIMRMPEKGVNIVFLPNLNLKLALVSNWAYISRFESKSGMSAYFYLKLGWAYIYSQIRIQNLLILAKHGRWTVFHVKPHHRIFAGALSFEELCSLLVVHIIIFSSASVWEKAFVTLRSYSHCIGPLIAFLLLLLLLLFSVIAD